MNTLKNIKKQTLYLIAIALFIIINVLISSFALRLDLSSGHAYSLSPATKKIIKNLDKTTTIKFFVSSDLPTRLIPLKNDVIDLLDEYKRANRKIQMQFVDPKKDQKVAGEARENGIPELQFSQLDRDKYAVTTAYFGLLLTNGDKKESIPQVTDTTNLEYNLSAALYKLSQKELIKLGVIGLQDTLNPQEDPIGTLRRVLQQQFSLENVGIGSSAATQKLDQLFKTVLVFGGQQDFDESAITTLNSYVNEGGKVVVFSDGVKVEDNLVATKAQSKLLPFLSSTGLTLNQDLVLSNSAELVNFGNQMVNFLTPYPFWIKTGSFNTKTSYFSNVSQMSYPWVSSITAKSKNGWTAQELVRTSKESWDQKDNFALSPQAIPQPTKNQIKDFVVSAETKNKNGGHVVLIPSSRFVLDRFLSRSSDNVEFVLNMVNDMASGGALSGIRARSTGIYPLTEISENNKDIFKYGNMFVLPALLALYGAWRLVKRR